MKKEKGNIRPFPAFRTLAEALEAGEPSIADKIIGEPGKGEKLYFHLDTPSGAFIAERVFKTLSGGYVIIARQETHEEKTAIQERARQEKEKYSNDFKERTENLLFLPGYILIAYGNPYGPDGYSSFNSRWRAGSDEIPAYYIPKTGPRYVYQWRYKIAWGNDPVTKHEIMTFKTPGNGGSRWGRHEIADSLKNEPADYNLTAPLWLLTSIPDPRPRYLESIGEGEGKTITPPFYVWGKRPRLIKHPIGAQ